jgi:hypothetical protein
MAQVPAKMLHYLNIDIPLVLSGYLRRNGGKGVGANVLTSTAIINSLCCPRKASSTSIPVSFQAQILNPLRLVLTATNTFWLLLLKSSDFANYTRYIFF